jgi:hypothetical protein
MLCEAKNALDKIKQVLVDFKSDTSCNTSDEVERYIALVLCSIQFVHIGSSKKQAQRRQACDLAN